MDKFSDKEDLQVGRHAVILAPVMPEWDNGVFGRPLINLFEKKFKMKITLVDTVSVLDGYQLPEALCYLEKLIKNLTPKPELIVGIALGGALAQKLTSYLTDIKGVLCISAPGFMDQLVKERLNTMVSSLNGNMLAKALSQLSDFVSINAGENHSHPLIIEEKEACQRMLYGFKLLLSIDARKELLSYTGEVLSLIGDSSKLASLENQALCKTQRKQNIVIITDSGMRPLVDNPEQSLAVITNWMEKVYGY